MRLRNQSAVRELLERIQKERRYPGGLLFYGLSGVGKTTAALDFARGALCLEEKEWGCGSCSSCLHYDRVAEDILSGKWEGISLYDESNGKKILKYLSGEHPDFIYVPPYGGSLRIDQIRAVKDFAYMRPALSHRKVVVLEDAHTMTKEAGNALLKVLEEPPSDTLFILISESKDQLLPTIVSRTYQVEFHPLEEEVFYSLLGEENEELYRVSGGSYSLAKLIKDRGEVLKMVDDFLSLRPDTVYQVALRLD